MKPAAAVSVLLSILLLWAPAGGQEAPPQGQPVDSPWETFSFKIGGFITALNSDVSLGLQNQGTGITVDVEDTLNLSSSMTVLRTEAVRRFGSTRKHKVNVAWSAFLRSAASVLPSDVDIGDKTYPAGTSVESEFNFSLISAKYLYSVYMDDRFNLGLGAGAYIMPFRFKISGSGQGTVEESATAPLPVFSFQFDFAVTPNFFIRQNLDFLYLEIGDFRGAVVDIGLGAEYKGWKHFGIGAEWNSFQLGVEAEGDDYPGADFVGKINFGYNAILLYGKIYF